MEKDQHLLYRYSLQKAMCQEVWPNTQKPYGEPFEHYQMLESVLLPTQDFLFHQDWREYFIDTLGVKVDEGKSLEELEPRINRVYKMQEL